LLDGVDSWQGNGDFLAVNRHNPVLRLDFLFGNAIIVVQVTSYTLKVTRAIRLGFVCGMHDFSRIDCRDRDRAGQPVYRHGA
jgi:hypothetical protein